MNDLKLNKKYLLLVPNLNKKEVNSYEVITHGQGNSSNFFAYEEGFVDSNSEGVIHYNKKDGLTIRENFTEYQKVKDSEGFFFCLLRLLNPVLDSDLEVLSMIDVGDSLSSESITVISEEKKVSILSELKVPFRLISETDVNIEETKAQLLNESETLIKKYTIYKENLSKLQEFCNSNLSEVLNKELSTHKITEAKYLTVGPKEQITLSNHQDLVGFQKDFNQFVLEVKDIPTNYSMRHLEVDTIYFTNEIKEEILSLNKIFISLSSVQEFLNEKYDIFSY